MPINQALKCCGTKCDRGSLVTGVTNLEKHNLELQDQMDELKIQHSQHLEEVVRQAFLGGRESVVTYPVNSVTAWLNYRATES